MEAQRKRFKKLRRGYLQRDGGTEGPDLNSEDPEGEEFKKGENSTPEMESEGPSLQGDKGTQESELLEIDDQYIDVEPEEDRGPSTRKDPLDKKDPDNRSEREKKTPDLSESKQYRRSKRKKKPPDRLEYK